MIYTRIWDVKIYNTYKNVMSPGVGFVIFSCKIVVALRRDHMSTFIPNCYKINFQFIISKGYNLFVSRYFYI